MEINTFWNIVIKGIGLSLLVSCLYVIPEIGNTIAMLPHNTDWSEMIIPVLYIAGGLAVFLFITYFFLFRSNIVIDRLNLNRHFTEEKIDVNISSGTVLNIVVIILGGLTFVDALPNLVQILLKFFRQKELIRDYPAATWLVYHALRALIGYLIMTNSRVIVKYIGKQAVEYKN